MAESCAKIVNMNCVEYSNLDKEQKEVTLQLE